MEDHTLKWPIAFVHLMKTGGQTIRAILQKNFGPNHCDMLLMEEATPRDWRWVKTCYPFLRSVRGHCVLPGDNILEQYYPNSRYYTFLRDPIKRAISHYRFREQSGDALAPLEDWLKDYGDYMCYRLAGERNASAAIEVIEKQIEFVGLTERFDESLLLWRHWVGLAEADLNYQTVNKRKVSESEVKKDTAPKTIEMIREFHQEDQKLYDYVSETVFPQQIEKWGNQLDEELAQFERDQKQNPSNKNVRSQLGRLKRNCLYRIGVRKVEGHIKQS